MRSGSVWIDSAGRISSMLSMDEHDAITFCDLFSRCLRGRFFLVWLSKCTSAHSSMWIELCYPVSVEIVTLTEGWKKRIVSGNKVAARLQYGTCPRFSLQCDCAELRIETFVSQWSSESDVQFGSKKKALLSTCIVRRSPNDEEQGNIWIVIHFFSSIMHVRKELGHFKPRIACLLIHMAMPTRNASWISERLSLTNISP
jgi:hypothetical protein